MAESEWLWPIGFGTKRPGLSRTVVFPLMLFDREKFSDGLVQRRRVILPLLYSRAGRGPADFFLLPFGGVIHNFFGREKIVLVLWPLFVYQRGAQARSWSFLHPVFTYVRWEDGGRGFKVWPLFGLNRRPGKMTKLFVLWPIFHYQRMKLEQGELKRWWLFPFYGRIASPGGWEWAVLWPFFSHRVDRNLAREDWWYPWPFLGRHFGEDLSGWKFWPLFTTERRKAARAVRFLWPLGWYDRRERGEEKSRSFRLIPLMFRQKEETAEGRSGAWQLWPLIKVCYGPESGERSWAEAELPSVLPMRYYAPWERNFAKFFRLFEYHRDSEGTRSWRLLWRLARVDSGRAGRYVEVTPLFKYQTLTARPPAASTLRWNILKGLLGYEREGGRRKLRFLYLIRLGLGRVKVEGSNFK